MNHYVLLIGMNFELEYSSGRTRTRVGDIVYWRGTLDDLDSKINEACGNAVAKAAKHFSSYTTEIEFSWYLYENSQEMIDWTSKADV